MSMNPLSSRKTKWAPSSWAFFYMGPFVPFPMRNTHFVALDGASLWHSARPTAIPQYSPNMMGVVMDTKLVVYHTGNAL
jgi:hypothetical protein